VGTAFVDPKRPNQHEDSRHCEPEIAVARSDDDFVISRFQQLHDLLLSVTGGWPSNYNYSLCRRYLARGRLLQGVRLLTAGFPEI
jgi:hypothetical protein